MQNPFSQYTVLRAGLSFHNDLETNQLASLYVTALPALPHYKTFSRFSSSIVGCIVSDDHWEDIHQFVVRR